MTIGSNYKKKSFSGIVIIPGLFGLYAAGNGDTLFA
jgi:hypothetical protein